MIFWSDPGSADIMVLGFICSFGLPVHPFLAQLLKDI
jgi:hypothetical protein